MGTAIRPGIYKHYKGKEYRVIGTAIHSETLEVMVYYECLYENNLGQFWVRPISMFLGEVQIDGQTVPRFQWVEAPYQ